MAPGFGILEGRLSRSVQRSSQAPNLVKRDQCCMTVFATGLVHSEFRDLSPRWVRVNSREGRLAYVQ